MRPILYEQTETEFTSQGIGVLSDVLSCIVTEELNNMYDLEMTYPVSGVLFEHLTLRRIIKTKANQTDGPQPFRIYRITKPMNGVVTVHAHHFSYDLSGMVVPPFTVTSSAAVIATITATALPTIQPFSFTNYVTSTKEYQSERPQSARAILGGFLNVYGGDLSYDGSNIKIDQHRGSDKGAVIAYGKNLMDLTQEENCADICTGIFPYYHTEENDVVLPEKVIHLPGTFDFTRIIPVDLTDSFPESIPTTSELRAAANQYISEKDLGVPVVSLNIQYLSIEDSDEAIPLHMFEGIALGDLVTVKFDRFGISTKSRCVKYEYNSVLERVESITIGDEVVTFVDTAAKQYAAVQHGEYQAEIMDAVAKATNLITNGLGGYVIIHKSNPSLANPDELLILGDSPDLSEAQKVWRWNRNGLGYSSTGYNGIYNTAITNDGQIVADMITTGILRAIEITNGNGFHVSPAGEMTATSGTIGGFTIETDNIHSNAVRLHNDYGLQMMNNGVSYGRIAKLGTSAFGVVLNGSGTSFTLNVEKSNGTIETVLSYDKANDRIDMYKNVYMHNKVVYNCNGVEALTPGVSQSFYYETYQMWSNIDVNYAQVTIKRYCAEFNSCGQFIRTYQISEKVYPLEYWHLA